MTAPTFVSLGLSEAILRALQERDYVTPTPIQARAIPHLLEGRDLLGIAQTGTGKTAAFALPMLQRLAASKNRPMPQKPRSLVLAPTRELATQIADSFEAYGKNLGLRGTIVFGGVGQNPQVQALRRGVDILVATPGRLLDLIQQRFCDLSQVEILVLDEADRMLDMGFLPDVKRILSRLPKQRQSLLFSATMPADITALAHDFLIDPVRVEVTPPAKTADRIEQSVWFVTKAGKRDLLAELLEDPAFQRTLVFTRTKHGADRVVKHLRQVDIHAHAIHGNKSQNNRERALDDFRTGRAPVLVATDIAARGIDVPEISHVVNFDLPNVAESYVHRIGRTARAGRDGIAISFCDAEEREYLRDIEKLIRQKIPVAGDRTSSARRREPAHAAPAERPSAATRRDPHNPWHAPAKTEAVEEFGMDPAEIAQKQAPQRPVQRQRPPQREVPGPYLPSPPRPARDSNPRHEQRRQERPHKGRPATPDLVDPELRREKPPQRDPQRPPQRHSQRPMDSQRHPHSRPHQDGPSRPHGGGRPRNRR